MENLNLAADPTNTFSLYLHIPFCEKKCLYCDFFSEENKEHLIEPFLTALHREIGIYARQPFFQNRKIKTIFLGGGTPSLLTPFQLEKLFQAIDQNFKVIPGAEITLETNPGTVEKERLSGFRSAGVNRLSFGVQSFYRDDLEFLTRIHTPEDVLINFDLARKAGFTNINLDLIYALPGQTPERWISNLQQAISLGPEHISAYSLIIEPHTPLKDLVDKHLVTPASPDREAELHTITEEVLTRQGYRQYEISNYAKEDRQCRHNLAYWNLETYLGLGPSAHSFAEGRRWWNYRSTTKYIEMLSQNLIPQVKEEILTEEEKETEFIYLSLRQRPGLHLPSFEKRYGKNFLEFYREGIRKTGPQFVTIEEDRLTLTDRGWKLADEVALQIMT